MTPLIFAAIGGHDDVCERLLAKGALVGAKDRHGRTALSYAQKLGRDSVTRLLLAHAGEAEGVRRQCRRRRSCRRRRRRSCRREQ